MTCKCEHWQVCDECRPVRFPKTEGKDMTKELLQQALDALTRLSFLGNGDFPGNSEGNRIAQKAVADIKQALAQQAHFEEQPDGTVIPVDPSEKAQQEQPANRVYLVATGEVHEGQETYTRHDTPPPLCDYETLFTQAQTAQEPVGFTSEESIRALKESGVSVQVYASRGTWFDEPLYTRPAPAMPTHEAIYETIINWDEGGKRSRRELARRIEALYTHPAPTQPALSDKQILDIFGKVSADGMGHYMTAVGRAIEAHCRGGASHE